MLGRSNTFIYRRVSVFWVIDQYRASPEKLITEWLKRLYRTTHTITAETKGKEQKTLAKNNTRKKNTINPEIDLKILEKDLEQLIANKEFNRAKKLLETLQKKYPTYDFTKYTKLLNQLNP